MNVERRPIGDGEDPPDVAGVAAAEAGRSPPRCASGLPGSDRLGLLGAPLLRGVTTRPRRGETYRLRVAWDRVGGGRFEGGDSFSIERHVIYFGVQGNNVLPIRLRSYRWRLIGADGRSSVQAKATSRDEIEAMVSAYGASGSSEPLVPR